MSNLLESIVALQVSGAALGVPLGQVNEINRGLDLTPVPCSPSAVLGVVNLRGEIVTLLDLGEILFGRPAVATADSRIVIVQVEDEKLGLMIDRVGDVVSVVDHPLEAMPSHVPDSDARFFRGVLQQPSQLILVIDIDTVCSIAGEAVA